MFLNASFFCTEMIVCDWVNMNGSSDKHTQLLTVSPNPYKKD